MLIVWLVEQSEKLNTGGKDFRNFDSDKKIIYTKLEEMSDFRDFYDSYLIKF